MLISFAVTNYLSFRDRTELSMLAVESDDSLLNNVKNVPIKRSRGAKEVPLLKSAAIYGPNASGKSNLIKALTQALSFIAFDTSDSIRSANKPFLLDPQKASEPSEFEFKFLLDGIVYRYGFTVLNYIIHEEWLFSTEKKYEKLVFEREWYDDISLGPTAFGFGPSSSKHFKDVVSYVRTDTLLLSVGAKFNAPEAMTISSFSVHPLSGRLEPWVTMGSSTKDHLADRELKVLTRLLQYADIGLEEIRVTPFNMVNWLNIQGPGFPVEEFETEFVDNLKNLRDLEFMYADSSHKLVSISQQYQSSGTKYLFSLFLTILRFYRNGTIFICDELEQSLHPMLCEALLRFFHCLPNNNSQLIFTTHNSDLLNADVLRRDQVWIMEKDQSGQSCVVSLSDFKGVRKGAKLGKHYLEGMFGGLPVLDEHIMRNILKALDEDGEQES